MGWISSIAGAPAKGASALWRVTPVPMKNFALGSLVAGGAAALVTYDAVRAKPRGKRFDADEVALQPLPPLLTPQDLMMQPMPQMQVENGPAEGRGEFEFRNRVLAGRGQALEQPAQPRMSVIDPKSVSELNAPNTTLAV